MIIMLHHICVPRRMQNATTTHIIYLRNYSTMLFQKQIKKTNEKWKRREKKVSASNAQYKHLYFLGAMDDISSIEWQKFCTLNM